MGFRKHKPSQYPSLLLWFLDETHVTVTAATAAVIAYRQDAHALYFAVGALGSTLVARALKYMIRHPRPAILGGDQTPRTKKTYGMPSTHSTALGFYLVYLWPLLPLISSSFLAPTTELWVERAALLAITGLGLWSRVALGYHTLAQVLAGTTVGTVGALVWARTWATHPDIGPVIQSIIDTSRERALTLVT